MDLFRFAHLTDPHLPLPPGRPPLGSLMSKRLFGYLSWHRKRHKVHQPHVLELLARDMRDQRPDHVVVTGDLANIALPGEFANGRAWLESLGDPERVTAVPGNHDTLVRTGFGTGIGLWDAWMRGDGDGAGPDPRGTPDLDSLFPAIRRRGPIGIVGLNSGVPTPVFMATGRVGPDQMARAEAALDQLGREGRFRVVLLHHPLADDAVRPRKSLTDRRAVRDMLSRVGAELVLHGHAHRPHVAELAGPHGPIPSITAPSASALPHGQSPGAAWNLVEVRREGDGWHVGVTARGLPDSAGGFRTLSHREWRLTRPTPFRGNF